MAREAERIGIVFVGFSSTPILESRSQRRLDPDFRG